MGGEENQVHIFFFPFMANGHMIPNMFPEQSRGQKVWALISIGVIIFGSVRFLLIE
jgi:hypothetical protein